MGYVQPSDAFDAAMTDLRVAIRDRTKATTTFGYGPRFLHSTGQMHKGGPATACSCSSCTTGRRTRRSRRRATASAT